MAKKGKLGRILKALFFAFIFAFLIIAFHYLYFEMTRIEGFGVKLFQDWRSYVAYVFSKIPYLKDRIEYKPMKIGNASEYYGEVFSGAVKDLGEKLRKLEEERKEVESLKKRYEDLINVLRDIKSKLESEYESERKKLEVYKEGKARIEELSKLIESSEPAQIAVTLSQENLSVDTIAAVLRNIPQDVAAEVIQELSKINPQKSADVLNRLGSVEKIYEDMEKERRSLEEMLKEVARERANLIDAKALKESISKYFENLSPDEIVSLMIDLKLDPDTIAGILSTLSRDKFLDVMAILQRNHPAVFKAVVEKGVIR